jgi:fatty-acyl-CoA synthase
MQDKDGYFYLTGRKKELIIRGGHNIDPQIIEEPLHQHPAVQLAAAVGRPDIHAGELPVAYVQLRSGNSVSESDLMEFAQKHIPERAAHPKAIHIIEQMPLTTIGKIFKPDLKYREIRSAIGAALEATSVQIDALQIAHSNAGIQLKLCVKSEEEKDLASLVLGQFAFQFEITTACLPIES